MLGSAVGGDPIEDDEAAEGGRELGPAAAEEDSKKAATSEGIGTFFDF